MKVRSSIRALCPHCYIVRRGKSRFVYCKENPKHKQRQGFHTSTVVQQPTTLSDYHVPQFTNPHRTPIFPINTELCYFIESKVSVRMNPVSKYCPAVGIFGVIHS